MISRRKLVLATLASSTALASFGAYTFWPNPAGKTFRSSDQTSTGVFAHGVASGDPSSDGIIIWSHVDADGVVPVTWDVALDEEFAQILRTDQIETGPSKDWTVKVDVDQLRPGTEYFYRFHAADETSPVGRFRTLPDGPVDHARFAVVSCSSWQHGYFNVYDHIARHDHFDALIHLGDYFYEYGTTEKAGQPKAGPIRLHEPAHEVQTLADYRMRLAQYRTDPSLQAVTARLPLIAMRDDHEVANDSFVTGAANHNEGEGSWEARKQAALQAYYEWLPVREPKTRREESYRSYEWGDLATIVSLESRLVARDEPLIVEKIADIIAADGGVERFNAEILEDEARELIGDKQRRFVVETFGKSKQAGKPWRILANQVVMGRVATPDLNPHVTQEAMDNIRAKWSGIDDFVSISTYRLPFDLNGWDAYPAERRRLYNELSDQSVNDLLVITGDAHEYWVNDLTNDDGAKMGVEFGTTSVTSSTLQTFLGSATDSYALLMTRENPDVRYYNPRNNGYIDLSLNRDEAISEHVSVDTVWARDYSAFRSAKFTVKPKNGSLSFSDPRGLSPKQWALYNGLG